MSKDIWSNKKEQSKAKRYIIELIKKRLSRKYKRNKLKIEDIKWDVARWEIREISPMGISHLSAREKKEPIVIHDDQHSTLYLPMTTESETT